LLVRLLVLVGAVVLRPGAIILLDIKARFDYTLKDALRQTLPANLSLRPVCNVRPPGRVRFPLAGYMLVESASGDTGLLSIVVREGQVEPDIPNSWM
jgi:hypothetical protein